ncbi:glycosyl hydrolase [Aspergillus unguis]
MYTLFWSALAGLAGLASASTYQNPILPGWHSDPSCVFVPEWDNTFFCTTSSFLAFPGLPIYASKDLIHWKHASNAYNRRADIPGMLTSTGGQQQGPFASTLRMHEGEMYIVTAYIGDDNPPQYLLWTTTDPFSDDAWTGPVTIPNPSSAIDPDLFWDDDGSLYVASSGLYLQQVDLQTGNSTPAASLWNGTGGRNIEGPHLYKKDGWYYLLAAEGGTETNHSVTMARASNVWGPYESAPGNPLLTNRGTDEYFQTVGHADLFQDEVGNWWGVALATRSGPEWTIYPMGRETVLFPVTWAQGDFPIMEPVRGYMEGPLPRPDLHVPGDQWVDGPDENLPRGETIPSHFVHWRPPPNRSEIYRVENGAFSLTSSRANLTADASYKPTDGQTFTGRRQSHTNFVFSIDVEPVFSQMNQETGLSVFLTSYQHIDLSVVALERSTNSMNMQLRTESLGQPAVNATQPVTVPLPPDWQGKRITLRVEGDETSYHFYAALSSSPQRTQSLGTVSAEVVSGGTGPFTGTLLGAFATTNGGPSTFESRVSGWNYIPISQRVE